MGFIEARKDRDGRISSYRAQVRLKGHPPANASFKRKTDAMLWIQQTEAAMRTGRYQPLNEAKKRTLAEAIERYVEEELSKKALTYNQQASQLQWFKNEAGHLRLSDVTPSVLSSLKNKLLKEKNGQKIIRKGSSVNRYFAALSAMFRTAKSEWQWINANPVHEIRKEPESPGIVRFLSDDERARLLSACKEDESSYIHLVVVLALATGMRKEELMQLNWSDVDLETGTIFLHKTKNKERRRVPVRGLALDMLREHRTQQKPNTALLFPSPITGMPMDIRKAWERVRRAAKIENFRFHDLRHSTASYLAMNGASLLEIAEILGHKSLAMVKRYSHLSEGHTANVLSKMNERIFGTDRK